MPSRLAWLDHDPEEQAQKQRMLALLTASEPREELGLGAIRDAIADRLFPGTSTVQTRLRYMLFVPWIYSQLESDQVPSARVARRGRAAEVQLIGALLSTDDQVGVYGRRAGGDLRRLPSSIYWAGLGVWGLRRFEGSHDEYHRSLDSLYALRRQHAGHIRATREREESDAVGPEARLLTWHPRLPKVPDGFPQEAELRLTREEAEFLLDCLCQRCPGSLLSHLALAAREEPPTVDDFWMHPGRGDFPAPMGELVHHAQCFAEVMHGAALLYNLMLSERAGLAAEIDLYSEVLATWESELDRPRLRAWPMEGFWSVLGQPIMGSTMRFVTRWIELALLKLPVAEAEAARTLVYDRERLLKGSRARLVDAEALNRWGGSSGAFRLNFRWPTVRSFLKDLHGGLSRA